MPADLRSFLRNLEDRAPGSVKHVRRRVSAVGELASVVKLAEQAGNPVLIFHDVEGSSLSVVAGIHASRDRLASALGGDPTEIIERVASNSYPRVEPERLTTGPIKDSVLTGHDVDLSLLPVVTHAPGDAGPYIGGGVGLARDPRSGAINLGIYRLMVKGPRTLSCHINPFHHLAEIIRRDQEDGRDTEIAIVIGHHPAFQIGSQLRVPISDDVQAHVGGLLGEPVLTVPAETIGIEVPAYAEIVLECVVRPGETVAEGPYGEFTYYYGSDPNAFLLDVRAIARRRDALYMDIHNVHREHRTLWIFPAREANLLAKLRDVLPRTRAVHIPNSGAGLHAYVSIEKLREGDGKNAILTALAADHVIKHVVIVDADVDPADEAAVAWAIATRFQADVDMIVVPGSHSTSLDPSSYSLDDRHRSTGITTKVGLDATRTVQRPFSERADTVDSAYADLDLAEYIDAGRELS